MVCKFEIDEVHGLEKYGAVPKSYEVELDCDFEKDTFKGRVDIMIEARNETKNVLLDAQKLEIQKVLFDDKIECENSYDKQENKLNITMPQVLKSGEMHKLSIMYSGIVKEGMSGLYKSEYIGKGADSSNKVQKMYATQFEACDARCVIPCFDHPSLKATFKSTVITPKDCIAISNTRVVEKKMVGEKMVYKFDKTPLMSTYLLAYAIGKTDSMTFEEMNVDDKLKISIYMPKVDPKYIKNTMNIAKRSLKFFERYFGIDYPLNQLILLGVPDFAAGAMENWGLITFRVIYLMYEDEMNIWLKQNMAYTISHELAHQWFGNLVTMRWWDDLWLNEGFATWAASLAISHLCPEWNVELEFLLDETERAMRLDSFGASHSVKVPVKNPEDISQIFDSISYSKAASLIRMLNFYLEGAFKVGLRNYLSGYKYKNAKSDDLWNSFSEASGKNICKFMDSWINIPGFPLISVREIKDGSHLNLVIEQTKFAMKSEPEKASDLWNVPLKLLYSQNGDFHYKDLYLSGKSLTCTLPSNLDYYKLNVSQCGFYRVKNDDANLRRLENAISTPSITSSERYGIISDLFALMFKNHVDVTVPVKYLKHYGNETEYAILKNIIGNISDLRQIYSSNTHYFDKFSGMIVDMLDRFVPDDCDSINNTPDLLFSSSSENDYIEAPDPDSMWSEHTEFSYDDYERNLGNRTKPCKMQTSSEKMRCSLAISAAGESGSKRAIAIAKELFNRHFSKSKPHKPMPKDLMGSVLKIVVMYGDASDYDKVFDIYRNATFETEGEKMFALSALGQSKDINLVNKSLEMLKKDGIIRHCDYIHIIKSVADNCYMKGVAWKFIKTNWDYLNRIFYTSAPALLQRIISLGTSDLTELSDVGDISKFFSDKDRRAIQRAIDQSIDKINISISFRNNNANEIIRLFPEH